MDLKVKDVADLLNVSEGTIHRWLVEGKIPGYRINQQYLFNRSEIEDWVMQHKGSDGPFGQHPHQAEESEHSTATAGNKQFSLYRALHKGNVIVNMPGKTKEEIE